MSETTEKVGILSKLCETTENSVQDRGRFYVLSQKVKKSGINPELP